MQLVIDQEEFEIKMDDEDFKRDVRILMTNQDVNFKVNKLIIRNLTSSQVYILDWLILKSPNLIDLQIQ